MQVALPWIGFSKIVPVPLAGTRSIILSAMEQADTCTCVHVRQNTTKLATESTLCSKVADTYRVAVLALTQCYSAKLTCAVITKCCNLLMFLTIL